MNNGGFLLLNVVGGVAVLGGYWLGIDAHSGENDRLWGEIPESVRGVYSFCMFPAAFGYLVSFAYLMKADWSQLRFASRPAAGALWALHSVFLLTAALWMPLTWSALDHGTVSLYWPIQVLLLVTGLCSAGLVLSLRSLIDPPHPRQARWAQWSLLALVFQCLVLDGLVWPRFFVII